MSKSFKEVTTWDSNEGNNLLIVDGLNLAFRWKHRGQTEFAAEFLRTVTSLAKSYKAKDVVILADKGKSAYRVDLYPEYKGNRKILQEKQTEAEKDAFVEFLEGFKRAFELCSKSYITILEPNVEADDIAAYLVSEVSEDYDHTWLVSTDADWDLLLNPVVSRFSYKTTKEYTLDNFYEEHGCDDPEQYISIKVLSGDSGDNVPGFNGVATKRAYKLLREYGDAYDILFNLPLEGKQAIIREINEKGEEVIERNYALMDLVEFNEQAINFKDADTTARVLEKFESGRN